MSRTSKKTSASAPLAASGADPPRPQCAPDDATTASESEPGSLNAPGGPRPSETIPFTVEPITFISQGVTYRTERTTLIAKLVCDSQANPPAAPPEASREDLSLAAKVFELLTALDPDQRLRKAPPIRVFNLYYRQRLGAAEIARKCDCDRSLIYDRLAAIQATVSWTPARLQEVSPHVEAMEQALTDSRAHGIYRKGAVYGEEDDNQEDE